jgi:hypothetical protein
MWTESIAALLSLVVPAPADPPVVRDVTAVVDLWELARPRDWEVFQDSSFDRTGGNDDGFSGRYGAAADATGARVLFDHDGPGAITRIWSANPQDDCELAFYFDDEAKPRVRASFAALFRGIVSGFPKPFVDDAHGGFVAYVPIPYAKRLRVVATGPLYFWQITAARFPVGTDVASFDPDGTRTHPMLEHVDRVTATQAAEHYASATPLLCPGDVVALPTRKAFATADGRPIPTFAPVQFPCSLGPDQAVALEIEGPAVVTSLRLRVEAEGSRCLRTTLVRVFVDDDAEPWVEAPLGDLFALVDGNATTHALPFVAAPPEYELRFVQPFARSLRVHVIQTGDEPLRVDASALGVRGSIDAFGAHRFFARWQRTLTKRGEPLVLLDAHGSGHVVGVTYVARSAGGITYLEGDEAIAIDGRAPTAYHGTGTEDFFDSGWYWRAGTFCAPLFGLTHKDEPRGSIAAYRMFTTTAIPFTNSLRFTLEHGGGNDAPYVEIATVTYGYASAGTTLGIPRIDPRDLVPAARSDHVASRSNRVRRRGQRERRDLRTHRGPRCVAYRTAGRRSDEGPTVRMRPRRRRLRSRARDAARGDDARVGFDDGRRARLRARGSRVRQYAAKLRAPANAADRRDARRCGQASDPHHADVQRRDLLARHPARTRTRLRARVRRRGPVRSRGTAQRSNVHWDTRTAAARAGHRARRTPMATSICARARTRSTTSASTRSRSSASSRARSRAARSRCASARTTAWPCS